MQIAELLSQTSLFAEVPLKSLRALEHEGSVSGYRGGMQVYERGHSADCIYIVLSGRLRAETPSGDLVAEIGRLETVGEIGVLSNQSRTTNVYAARDSVLLRIDREPLMAFLRKHPDVLQRMTEAVVRRLTRPQRRDALDATRRPRSFAVMPADPGVAHAEVASRLRQALIGNSQRPVLDSAAVDGVLGAGVSQSESGDDEGRLAAYLADRESATRHLIYVTDRSASPWTLRSLRQSDRILVVVDARNPPQHSAMIDALRASGSRAAIDLVVLRNGGVARGRVREWKALTGATGHYYLDARQDADIHRIARSLSGRAPGLVLGGGGARGFAHLGLLRALKELNIPIDLIGGSSMGAFIGALAAHGHPVSDVLAATREMFVKRKLLNDYLLPRVALIRGRKFVAELDKLFGDIDVEDLPVPFYCVSTNLTRGACEVHVDGRLSTWVATSMAVPGVAPPVAWKGELLCDGAVINSLPTDVMAELGRGPIIASDVSTVGSIGAPGIEGPDPEGLFKLRPGRDDTGKRATLLSILFRTATLTNEAQVPQRAASSDAYLRLPVSKIGMFEWKKLEECERLGYEYAMQQLPATLSVLLG